MTNASPFGPRPGESENEPLLADTELQQQQRTHAQGKARVGITEQLHKGIEACEQHFVKKWPVWRIAVVVFFVYFVATSTGPELLEVSREIACARFYERSSPEGGGGLSQVSPKPSPEVLCDLDAIEQRSSLQVSLVDALGSSGMILSMFYVGPRLKKWGCKRVLMISMAFLGIHNLAIVLLPRGYPYGPQPNQLPISPSNISTLFVVFGVIGALAGQTMIPTCCLRLMMTEASNVSTKSANLQLLIVAMSLGVAVGPGLSSLVTAYFPAHAGKIYQLFASLWHTIYTAYTTLARKSLMPPSGDTGGWPVEGIYAAQSNVTPFLFALASLVVAITFTACAFPQDRAGREAPEDEAGQTPTEDAGTSEPTPSPVKTPLIFQLLPKTSRNGSQDWRVLQVFTVALLHQTAIYSLTIYLQYFGHFLHWGPEQVGYLISYLGAVRLFALMALVPFLLAYYERTVKRPALLRGMTIDEIKSHGTHASADEPPQGGESSILPLTPEDSAEADHELDGAVATWRAQVDRALLRTSWCLDVVGWILVAAATVAGNTIANLLGGFFVAFGAGATGARISVDVAIVGDVFANAQPSAHEDSPDAMQGHQDPSCPRRSGHSHPSSAGASQIYFSLITIAEGLSSLLAPVISSFVYRSTLSSFPAANWLFTSFIYVLCLVLHFSMRVHK